MLAGIRRAQESHNHPLKRATLFPFRSFPMDHHYSFLSLRRGFLLVWALHSRKQWLSAMKKMKKTKWGMREGLSKEVVLELEPEWDISSYATIRTCQTETQVKAKAQGGRSLMCSKTRKKVREQWRKEMKSEGRKWITYCLLGKEFWFYSEYKESPWKALSREKRQNLICLFKRLYWLLSGDELGGGKSWSQEAS